MLVVSTVNQLEEAVKLGAEEILVTGEIAGSVRDVFNFKSRQDTDARPAGVFPADDAPLLKLISEKSGVPVSQINSIMIISEDYSLLDAQLDADSPFMLVHKQCRIKD